MASLFAPKPQLVPIPSPNQVLTPAQQAPGSPPSRSAQQPSFLGSAAVPPPSQSNTGGKQLLGQ